jgi:hypothetical protein
MAKLKNFASSTWRARTFRAWTFQGGLGANLLGDIPHAKPKRQIEGYSKQVVVQDANGEDVAGFADKDTQSLRVRLVQLDAETVPSLASTGSVTVGTGSVQLSTTSIPALKGVVVKAPASNTGGSTVYVGNNSAVTAGTAGATDGFPLAPGDSITIPVSDPAQLWCIGSTSSLKAFFLVI